MGSSATLNPSPPQPFPLKGREFAIITLKLVPLDTDSINCKDSPPIGRRKIRGRSFVSRTQKKHEPRRSRAH